jgi:hypothetical protein
VLHELRGGRPGLSLVRPGTGAADTSIVEVGRSEMECCIFSGGVLCSSGIGI